MGIYTGSVYSGVGYSSPNYDTVEPFPLSEHYNYQELGIIAAAESAENRDMFMQAIGIGEANSLAQYGSDSVFYEAIDFSSVFKRIKMFFKKIIEKIQKIFHTFIAKMSSWFSSAKNFAKKYRNEIISNWGKMKNDLDYKGYKFENIITSASSSDTVSDWKSKFKGNGFKSLQELMNKTDDATIASALNEVMKKGEVSGSELTSEQIAKFRSDHYDNFKEHVRSEIVKAIKDGGINKMSNAQYDLDASGGYDQKEYTEELFKAFRKNEDSKDSMTKSEIEACYGSGATGILNFLTDFDKIKTNLEKCQKGMTNEIDKIIKGFDKAENDLVKALKESVQVDYSDDEDDTDVYYYSSFDPSKKFLNDKAGAEAHDKELAAKNNNSSNTNSSNTNSSKPDKKYNKELLVQCSVLAQDVLGFVKEAQIQAFGAALQAQKEACSQAKEVCVMAIGLSKKVTEESYDYGSSSGDFGSYANGLIESTVIH